jgi:electron transfer flavoprotein alpha subunit
MILVFSEKDEIAYELLSAAAELRPRACLLGSKVEEARALKCFAWGADKVYIGEDHALGNFYVETYAEALYQVMQRGSIDLLLLGLTKRGKELAGRVAQKLGAGCITGAINLKFSSDGIIAERYSLGGNTIAEETIKTEKKVIAVMPRTFKPQRQDKDKGEIIKVDLALDEPKVKIISREEKKGEAVNLEEAEVLVCVGRGLAKKEDLKLIEDLASALRGEVGCTRTLSSDYRWLSEERLVGMSGKRCKPKLSISIGISGQIQYSVGIMGSKVIVAINKDKDAPIFKIADYGIVGDLYQVVPKLTEKIKGLSG